jgi:hypothetical protein
MYRVGPPHILYEWKCYTPFKTSGAQGNGSLRHGGAASTTDGHSFAFGNTLEALRALVFGKTAMGQPDDPPLAARGMAGSTKPRDTMTTRWRRATSCTCSPPSPPAPSRPT